MVQGTGQDTTAPYLLSVIVIGVCAVSKEYFTSMDMREFINHLDDADKARTCSEGDTYRLSHDECGDHKGRLYVTKRDSGRYLFFCHNCQKRGSYTPSLAGFRLRSNGHLSKYKEKDTYTLQIHKGGYVQGKVVNLFANYLPNEILEFPVADSLHRWSGGKCFLGTHGLDCSFAPMLIHWGCGPKDSEPKTTQEFTGYQMWDVSKDRTHKVSHGRMTPSLFYDTEGGPYHKLLVIVEDPISALFVVIHTGGMAEALCLFGTNIQPEVLSEYGTLYDHVVVWLDSDSQDNLKLQAAMVRRLQFVNSSVYDASCFSGFNEVDNLFYTKEGKHGVLKHDPKNYKPSYLQEKLNRYLADF